MSCNVAWFYYIYMHTFCDCLNEVYMKSVLTPPCTSGLTGGLLPSLLLPALLPPRTSIGVAAPTLAAASALASGVAVDDDATAPSSFDDCWSSGDGGGWQWDPLSTLRRTDRHPSAPATHAVTCDPRQAALHSPVAARQRGGAHARQQRRGRLQRRWRWRQRC